MSSSDRVHGSFEHENSRFLRRSWYAGQLEQPRGVDSVEQLRHRFWTLQPDIYFEIVEADLKVEAPSSQASSC